MAKRIINWLFLRDLLVATVVSFSGISKVTEDTIIGKVSIFSKCVIRCLKHLAKKKKERVKRCRLVKADQFIFHIRKDQLEGHIDSVVSLVLNNTSFCRS